MLAALEAERAGHAAAAGVERVAVEAHARCSTASSSLDAHDRLVVAVAVDERLALQLRRLEVRRFAFEELAQQERLLAAAACASSSSGKG